MGPGLCHIIILIPFYENIIPGKIILVCCVAGRVIFTIIITAI